MNFLNWELYQLKSRENPDGFKQKTGERSENSTYNPKFDKIRMRGETTFNYEMTQMNILESEMGLS